MGQPLLSGKESANFVDVQKLHVIVTFGTTSVTSVQTREVKSFTRNAAGQYIVTLPRNYRTLVGIRGSWFRPAGATLQVDVDASTVTTDGKFTIESRVAAGTATDPATGDKLMLEILVSTHPFNDATV